jgi:cold shock CspA family protein
MENKDHNNLQRKRNIMNSLKETMKKIHDNPFPERYYIGVIKFYDSNKGFGFIASNNCGMNSPVYEQDFYVDSSSFLEESAKSDRRLVVFQWKAQSRGKRRAIVSIR